MTERVCRHCRGSGIDPKSHHRWTSGGHDDRSCPKCNGEGMRISFEEQILECPEDWVSVYKEYMTEHDVPFEMTMVEGKEIFILPRRYRPHAWKLERK